MSEQPKPKILTRLRIDEVSAVDRGAGERCRIVLAKRDDSDSRLNLTDVFKGKITAAEALGIHVDKSAEGDEAEGLIADDVVDNDGTDGGVPRKHRPISFDVGDQHLTFPNERAMAVWLAAQSRIRKSTSQDSTMTNIDMSAIVKAHGVALFKYIVSENNSFGLSEEDVVKLATEHAARIYPGDRGDVAFAKMFSATDEAGATLRAAVSVAKNASLQDAVTAEIEKDSREAVEELTKIGKARWPNLTASQRFARAFETNPELAKRAHRRPGPSTSFPSPTNKAISLEPRVTSGGMDSFLDVNADAPAAYAELMKLVEQQRREGETEAAAFERVFLDPANRTLAMKALGQRPTESSPPRQS
jgi:hypothetical protein